MKTAAGKCEVNQLPEGNLSICVWFLFVCSVVRERQGGRLGVKTMTVGVVNLRLGHSATLRCFTNCFTNKRLHNQELNGSKNFLQQLISTENQEFTLKARLFCQPFIFSCLFTVLKCNQLV